MLIKLHNLLIIHTSENKKSGWDSKSPDRIFR